MYANLGIFHHFCHSSNFFNISSPISCQFRFDSSNLLPKIPFNSFLDETHGFLRTVLEKMYDEEVAQATRIQYGGSVTPDSVDELMSMPEIDGCLVGGASLDAEKFGRIINFKTE